MKCEMKHEIIFNIITIFTISLDLKESIFSDIKMIIYRCSKEHLLGIR